jgi:hypothetical protein
VSAGIGAPIFRPVFAPAFALIFDSGGLECRRMKIRIRLALAAVLASAAALGFTVSVSRASTYGSSPWCAVVDEGAGNIMWQCQYQSAAECQPNVLGGNRGFCQRNPYDQAAAPQSYQGYRGGPPPPGSRWRYIGQGNYIGD